MFFQWKKLKSYRTYIKVCIKPDLIFKPINNYIKYNLM